MEIDSSKEIKKKLKKLSKYAKETALNKDYGDIAGTYMQHAKYLIGKDIIDANGKLVKKSKKCLMCKNNPCTYVLFPCRHACVCEPCREEHCIGTKDSSTQSAWRACPLCMDEIKIVLPRNGHEEEEYWEWVHEVKPPIPSHRDFVSNFKRAAGILREEGANATDVLHSAYNDRGARQSRTREKKNYRVEDSSDEDSFFVDGGHPGRGEQVVWHIKEEEASCCILS